MNRIILEFQNGERIENAGSKAPADISSILADNGYEKFYIRTSGGSFPKQVLSLAASSIKLICAARRNSLVVCQYPVYSKKGSYAFRIVRTFLKAKRVKIVALIHDLLFAAHPGEGKEEEVRELNKYDALIVHSTQMEAKLKEAGCIRPTVILGLFDYLIDKANEQKRNLTYETVFAGNLSKSLFINQLSKITSDSPMRFRLYGRKNQELDGESGIDYGGLFSPDDVSSLDGSWGLVWDGDSIDDLAGDAGLYQQVNSPHKASLYLTAGLPLIVSSKAAIANIVEDNQIGFTVNSLQDMAGHITHMTEGDYQAMLDRVKKYASGLTSGQSILAALEKVSRLHL